MSFNNDMLDETFSAVPAPTSTDAPLPPPPNGLTPQTPIDLALAPSSNGSTLQAPPVARDTARPQARHPGFFMSLLWCVFFLILTQVPGAVLAVVILVAFAVLRPESGIFQAMLGGSASKALLQMGEMQTAMLVAMGVTEGLVIAVSLLVLRLVVGRDWPRQVGLRRPSLAHLLLVLASFPSMLLLSNGAYLIVRQVLHVPSMADLGSGGMEDFMEVVKQWPWVLGVLIIGVGPGIGEELWCRGFLGRGLVSTHGVVLGVLFTSFFFGLIHVDPAQGLTVMFMALWLHFVYLTSRSLWMPILLHFLNNSLAVVISRFQGLEDVDRGTLPVLIFVSAGVLLAVVGLVLYRTRVRLAGPAHEPAWQPEYPGAAHPPLNSGTHLVRRWPAWSMVGLTVLALVQLVAVWIWLNPQG